MSDAVNVTTNTITSPTTSSEIRITDLTLLTVYKGHDMSDRDGLANFGDVIQDFRQGWQLWPSNEITYVIDDSVGNCERSTLTVALSVISRNSCLKFKRISQSVFIAGGGTTPALHVTDSGTGCFASLGFRSPGENIVNIASGCVNVGTVIHLVLHALGMFHEHQRPDRDNFVQIVTTNVDSNRIGGNVGTTKYDTVFTKAPEGLNAWTNITVSKPYDFSSIMHNGPCHYSVSEEFGGGPGACTLEPTLKAAPGKEQVFIGQQGNIGNRATLSAGDVWMLSQLYSCAAGMLPPNQVEGSIPPEDLFLPTEEESTETSRNNSPNVVEPTATPGDFDINPNSGTPSNEYSWPSEPEPVSLLEREFVLPQAPDARAASTPETTLCTANDAASFSWSEKAAKAGANKHVPGVIATKSGDAVTTPVPTTNPNEELVFKNFFREASSKRMMFVSIGGVVLLIVLAAVVGIFIHKRRQMGRTGLKAAVEGTPHSGQDDQVPLLSSLTVGEPKETGDTTDSEVYADIMNDETLGDDTRRAESSV